jgi:UDP-glucose 4-epimerase
LDGVEFIQGDIRDVSNLRRAMAGCEMLFHLAAQATVMGCEQQPVEAHEVNATGTYNILRLAREAGVRRVIVASSREVYGEAADLPVSETAPIRPKNVYGASKAAAEMYCSWASSVVELTVLRLTNVLGRGDTDRVIPRFLTKAAAGQPLVVYGGGQIIDFVSVDIVADAFIRAGFGSYVPGFINVGSGVGITIIEMARRIIELFKSNSELVIGPPRQGEVLRFVADITRMRQALEIYSSGPPFREIAGMCDIDTPISDGAAASLGDGAINRTRPVPRSSPGGFGHHTCPQWSGRA